MYSHYLGPVPAATTAWYRKTRATAGNAAGLRRELSDWLGRQRIDAEHHGNIVLAVYEAVANAVEHAYRAENGIGAAVAVSATYCPELGSLKIAVADQGRWRPPHPAPGSRGRGLQLMNLLATRTLVAGSEAGTTLSLHWDLPPLLRGTNGAGPHRDAAAAP
jgi:serine/threonine-protein kinase RsbW